MLICGKGTNNLSISNLKIRKFFGRNGRAGRIGGLGGLGGWEDWGAGGIGGLGGLGGLGRIIFWFLEED